MTTRKTTLTPAARAFADACHSNSLAELEAALRQRAADQTDCQEWGISASQWRLAIRTALGERLEATATAARETAAAYEAEFPGEALDSRWLAEAYEIDQAAGKVGPRVGWKAYEAACLDALEALRKAQRSAAAATLGRKGGKAGTPAQLAQRRAAAVRGGAPRLVVTYAEAYRSHVRWSVCREHAADTEAAREAREAAGLGPLGPVEHGAHRGDCDVCDPRA